MALGAPVTGAKSLPYLISTKRIEVVTAREADHKNMLRSKLSGGDCLPKRVHQDSFGFEPRQLGEDAGLGSGVQRDHSGDNMAVDQGVESKDFRVWFLCHFVGTINARVA
jgi:hypothetical protein